MPCKIFQKSWNIIMSIYIHEKGAVKCLLYYMGSGKPRDEASSPLFLLVKCESVVQFSGRTLHVPSGRSFK